MMSCIAKAFFLLPVQLLIYSLALANGTYNYEVDITNQTEDKIKVTCIVPKTGLNKIDFIFPNIIPGSYALKEYGRYIEQFKAIGSDGTLLKIQKADKYNYTILDADKLSRIEYYVNDTWEEKDGKKFIFQPGGTNIREENVLINHYGFFGFIDGFQNYAYNISVKKHPGLKAYTHLTVYNISEHLDVIRAASYDELADSPVMYAAVNEDSIVIDNTVIKICAFSENGILKAHDITPHIMPVALALKHFFGKLPVNNYVFMFYFADPANVPKRKGAGLGSGYGAMEHNYSSVYFLPETNNTYRLKKSIQEICAHEFLHILTPLQLHSTEIESFNFRTPELSKHLWLYEGVTEYFSLLSLLQHKVISLYEFVFSMREKMMESSRFDAFSMTEMSKNVVKPNMQKRYLSVYSRGAVYAMMLDLLIIDRSGGQLSLRDVLFTLAGKYGHNKPFDDEKLIGEIVAITHPDVADFFSNYIENSKPVPYEKFLKLIGYAYYKTYTRQEYSFGYLALDYNEEKEKFVIAPSSGFNILGVMPQDILLSINDEEISINNIDLLAMKFLIYNESEAQVKIKFLRNGKEMEVIKNPKPVFRTHHHYFYAFKDTEDAQKRNLKKFLGVMD